MLKILIGFLTGVAVGVAAALLMSPSSGEELRHHLHDVAEADRERMRVEYQRGMDQLHSRMDMMSNDISTALHPSENDEADNGEEMAAA
jgi:gas vesicle protein